MADVLDQARQLVEGQVITGRQEYHLEIFGAEEEAAGFSVVTCEVKERMGDPVVITLELTHPNRISRKHFLGKDARFSMSPLGAKAREFSGFVASYTTLKTSADFTKYRVVVKSHLARLDGVSRFRIYQHQSAPDIITAVLREHGIPDYLISTRLRRAYPQHLFRFQYGQSDLAYVQMLAQKAGIYLRIEETEYGDQVVLGDDIDHYIYEPELTLPYREVSGLNAARTSISELSVHAMTVPKSFVVAEYNPDKSYERFKDEASIAPDDPTTYGSPYVFGTGHEDFAGAKWEAQLRHEEAIAWQVVVEGKSTEHEFCTGRVFHTDIELDDAPDGLMVIEVMRNLICQATSFIYIENQFFVSGFVSEHTDSDAQASDVKTSQPLSGPAALVAGKGVAQWFTRKMASHEFEAPKNFICEELGNRIGRTIMSGVKEHFHVIITLPVHPEGALNDGTVMTQIHWTMQSLVFGSFSLLNRVRRFIKARELSDAGAQDWKRVLSEVEDRRYEDVDLEQCREYVTLLNLRNWEKLGERYVTEQIYVHNKTMIVDDRFALVGSANINDRSMLGSRDSEIAVLIADTETERHDIEGNGNLKITRNFARTLRKELWNKIFGITGNVRPAESLRQAVEQPANPASWKAIQQVADANTALYEAAFPFIPRNRSHKNAPQRSNFASIWPMWDPEVKPEEIKMAFNESFWSNQQSVPSAGTSLEHAKGFIVSLPIHWTKGENNNLKYASSLVVEVEPKHGSSTNELIALSIKENRQGESV